jgi:hypothetical protein
MGICCAPDEKAYECGKSCGHEGGVEGGMVVRLIDVRIQLKEIGGIDRVAANLFRPTALDATSLVRTRWQSNNPMIGTSHELHP